MIIHKNMILTVTLFFISSFILILGTSGSTLSKCPTTVATMVITPSDVLPVITTYVKNQLHNEVKSISPVSTLKTSPEWTVGWHQCYYFNPKVLGGGYAGFIPKGMNSAYIVEINLKNKSRLDRYMISLAYTKIGSTWGILPGKSIF